MNKYIKVYTRDKEVLKYIAKNNIAICVLSKNAQWEVGHNFGDELSYYYTEPCTKEEVIKYRLLYGT